MNRQIRKTKTRRSKQKHRNHLCATNRKSSLRKHEWRTNDTFGNDPNYMSTDEQHDELPKSKTDITIPEITILIMRTTSKRWFTAVVPRASNSHRNDTKNWAHTSKRSKSKHIINYGTEELVQITNEKNICTTSDLITAAILFKAMIILLTVVTWQKHHKKYTHELVAHYNDTQ